MTQVPPPAKTSPAPVVVQKAAAPAMASQVGPTNAAPLHVDQFVPVAAKKPQSSDVVSHVSDADEMFHNPGGIENGKLVQGAKLNPFGFEWFYFDGRASDGTQFVFSFTGPNILDVDLSTLTSPNGIAMNVGLLAQASRTKGQSPLSIQAFSRDGDVAFSKDPWELRIGKSTITMKEKDGLRGYHLHVDAIDPKTQQHVTGEIDYRATMPGFQLNGGNIAAAALPPSSQRWFVTVPKAEVSGWFKYEDANGKVLSHVELDRAEGYHDHDYGSTPLATANDGWYWWRADLPNGDVVWGAHLLGKSQPAFAGDQWVAAPPSDIVFIVGKHGKPRIATSQVKFNSPTEFQGPPNQYGLQKPAEYSLDAGGYHLEVKQKAVTADLGYYARHDCDVRVTGKGYDQKALGISEEENFVAFYRSIGLPPAPATAK